MGNSEPQATRTGSGREIALLVGVLLLVAAGTVVTYWIRSQSAEATNQAATAAPAQTPVPRPRTGAPAPTETEVIHADVYFDFKSTRLSAGAVRLLQEKFLVELGVPEPSIKVVTIGQEGSLCDEPSTECQQLNRRVHLEIRKLTRAAAEPVRPKLVVGDTLDTLVGRRQTP